MQVNLLNPCGGGYVTPAIKVVEFQPEGVLCGSGEFSTPTWQYDDDQSLGW